MKKFILVGLTLIFTLGALASGCGSSAPASSNAPALPTNFNAGF